MKTWKQPTLLSRNSNEINGSIMILETNKEEGEEYLFYFYKTNDYSIIFNNIKGLFLASSGISTSIFYDDYKILSFSIDNQLYKSTSKIYLQNYLINVIVPYITSDNILFFICDEFIKFCSLFFENFEDSKKFTNVLNKYSEILFYLTLNYTIHPDNEDIIGTPISLIPLINITFSYNEVNPIFLIKPGISDSIRTPLIEHMNSLNNDRSILQETLTLMDPPFYLKGYILMYRGFILFNSLSNNELANGARLALLHEIYMRTQSSPEILSCEFLFDDDKSNLFKSKEKKKTLTTLLAQREFCIIINLEILGKNNCTFDPFYHKRAEDLLVNLLKKNFSQIIINELYKNSIRMQNADLIMGYSNDNFDEEFNNGNEDNKYLKDFDSVTSNYSKKSGDSNSKKAKNITSNINNGSNNELALNLLNNKIQGFIDSETKINIIHFSIYDDNENIINTTDLNLTSKIFKDIYRYIFNIYAKIQTNINKIKSRNKRIKLGNLFSYNEIKGNDILRKDISTKTKMIHNNYLKSLSDQNNFNGKLIKLTEYGTKLNNDSIIPVWVCCKLYEHITVDDDINMDEYSNYKIIFVAYQSVNPVEIDSFCQDLMMNELFI